MRESKVDDPALNRALLAHVSEHGMAKWALVRAQFPEVSESTFWRSVSKYKKGATGTMGRQAQKETQKVIREIHRARDYLPAPVAPGTVIEHGVNNVRAAIDYLEQLGESLKVADQLRDASLTKDAEGHTKVRSAKILRDSARIRLDTVKAAASAMAFLADVKRMEQFFQAVIDEVGQIAPETQVAILDRLQALNQSYGMTTAAFL